MPFAFAVGFLLFMLSIAGQSTGPVELMRRVGRVSGVVCGLAVTTIALGRRGKSPAPTTTAPRER